MVYSRRIAPFLLLSLFLAGSHMNANAQRSGPLAAAVANRRADEVTSLLASGVSPDDRDERGQEAIIIAASTDQFAIANILVDRGANIWAANRLGFTPALFAFTSHVSANSPEGTAREIFISKLKGRGYPWPPPWQNEVVALRSSGNWPPAQAK